MKKLALRVMGRWVCITGRELGASSTTMSAASRTSAKVCNANATDIGDDGSARGRGARAAGCARAFGAGRASRSITPSRMLHTAEVPTGAHAAVVGSSINWYRLAPSGM